MLSLQSRTGIAVGILAAVCSVQVAHAELTARQESLIPIAAFTATGDTVSLRRALGEGLDRGLAVNEARDALVQLYAYAGFPRSLTALSELVSLLDERRAAGIRDAEGPSPRPRPDPARVREIGTAVQTRLIGRPASGAVYEFAPDIDAYLKEHLFGDIFSSGVLDDRTREVVTVSALAALPAPRQLQSHLNVCLNVGLTPEDLESYVRVLNDSVGASAGRLAQSSVEKVIDSRNK